MTAYFSEGPKRLLDEAREEIDNIGLDFKAVTQSISVIRGNLLELGITTDQEIDGGVQILQRMDNQIDVYLKQLFALRNVLMTYRENL